jgi:predicted amidophosphoribosyltransferase
MEGLQFINNRLRKEHFYLTPADECYYLFNYKPGVGYNDNAVNRFVADYKRAPATQKSVAGSKLTALAQVKRLLAACLPEVFDLCDITVVPVPPSKTRESAQHDDRNYRVLSWLQQLGLHAQELVYCERDMYAAHAGRQRPTLHQLTENLSVNHELLRYTKRKVVLFDDVLTSGAHYTACKQRIQEVLPAVDVAGVFIARRAIQEQPLQVTA